MRYFGETTRQNLDGAIWLGLLEPRSVGRT